MGPNQEIPLPREGRSLVHGGHTNCPVMGVHITTSRAYYLSPSLAQRSLCWDERKNCKYGIRSKKNKNMVPRVYVHSFQSQQLLVYGSQPAASPPVRPVCIIRLGRYPVGEPSPAAPVPAHIRQVGRRLDGGPSGEAGVALAVRPPVAEGGEGGDEPQQGAGEVDPDGVLHALDVGVALGVLVDVHAAEDAEEGDPQHEQHEIGSTPTPGLKECLLSRSSTL